MKSFGNSKSAPLISVLIPVHNGPETLGEKIPQLVSFFSGHYKNRYEIIVIPNPVLKDQKTFQAAWQLSRRYKEVRVCVTAVRPGKGLALKEGFGMAQGRWIFTTDADLPFDLGFFLEAERMLQLGFHLVTGNRRLPYSRFRVPTRVLHMVYQRALMGRLFNFFVRLLFPIGTTDTQAGIKAMTRETARDVFRRQVCPYFSYDIEMFLTAKGTGRRIAELPVVLNLPSEKSTIRILRSGLRAAYWIFRIFLLHLRRHYSHARTA